MADPAGIRARLAGAEYSSLFSALRGRLEEAWPNPVRIVTLPGLTGPERTAIADLVGWKTVAPSGPIKVRVSDVERALRGSNLATGLNEVLEALGGPLEPRAPRREAARDAKEQLWAQAAVHPAVDGRPELVAWLADLKTQGILARLLSDSTEQAKLLMCALAIIERLPTKHEVLSVLAADVAGDSHALDPGRPLSTVVLRAAARLAGWPEVPASSAGRRRLWADVGVLCDPLSTDVLVLGLRPIGSRLARHLGESADDGEPRRVTLRELTRSELRFSSERDVFVCENPSIVAAAADQLGERSGPLVCVEGVPTTAATDLLGRMRQAGVRVRFHADFDWAGLRIGNAVLAASGGIPWRFAATDYREATAAKSDGMPLLGTRVQAAWDGSLSAAMQETARAIFEEQVLTPLLADLESGSRP